MTTIYGKLALIISLMAVLTLAWAQFGDDGNSILSYSSPLRQPNILRSRPYVDFLSTLYRHDTDKQAFFQPYLQRSVREAAAELPKYLEAAESE